MGWFSWKTSANPELPVHVDLVNEIIDSMLNHPERWYAYDDHDPSWLRHRDTGMFVYVNAGRDHCTPAPANQYGILGEIKISDRLKHSLYKVARPLFDTLIGQQSDKAAKVNLLFAERLLEQLRQNEGKKDDSSNE